MVVAKIIAIVPVGHLRGILISFPQDFFLSFFCFVFGAGLNKKSVTLTSRSISVDQFGNVVRHLK